MTGVITLCWLNASCLAVLTVRDATASAADRSAAAWPPSRRLQGIPRGSSVVTFSLHVYRWHAEPSGTPSQLGARVDLPEPPRTLSLSAQHPAAIEC